MNQDTSDFMLAEYQNIANAHFETAKQISLFFRYYLIIISTPAFIFLMFDKNFQNTTDLLNGREIGITNYVSVFFIVVSIIGFLIFIYITKIRFDNILYARTVNGIRSYFKDNAGIELEKYLVLPTDISKPSYYQSSFFAIVLSFSLINSSITFLACWIVNFRSCGALIFLIIFAIHIISYIWWAKNKSNLVK